MSKNPVLYKTLVVGVILLFISIAVSPSIYANEIKEEELIEYTTTVCGLNGGKRTVYLTQKESQEVELLLDLIEEKLESAKSIDEAKEIYKEAIIELDKYGLLAGLSIKEAQKIVTRDSPFNKRLGINLENFQNIFCLIYGTVSIPEGDPGGFPPFCIPFSFLSLLGSFFGILICCIGALAPFYLLFYMGLTIINLILYLGLNPLKFMNLVFSDNCDWDITSIGLKGIVKSEYVSIILGYTGLMIYYSEGIYFNWDFLGFSLGFI